MAKTVRLEDDTYLDSTSIIYNEETLNNFLRKVPICGLDGGSKNINFQNVDNITSSGFYYGNEIINAPGKWGYLLVICHSNNAADNCTQFFTQQSNGGMQRNIIYTRTLDSGVWNDWVPMNVGSIQYVSNYTHNWDDLYNLVGRGAIQVFIVDVYARTPIGFPVDAYKYGLLIVICGHGYGEWADAQIYIPDGVWERGFYVRMRKGHAWLHVAGTIVNAYTE